MLAHLFVTVECDGATFRIGAADRANTKLLMETEPLMARKVRDKEIELGRPLTAEEREATAIVEDEDLSEEAKAAMCEMFVEGVRAWSGVKDGSGKPDEHGNLPDLPFTPENVREFPSLQKIAVMGIYFSKRAELEAKKASPAGPVTS